ncbi:MAG: AarF/ABC1/UbiB kinase family protein [Actinobacteria bacterium]|nr:AarF/ABC1/UbiB kinase family protein [Actinomycetota bacterium]
MSEYPPLPDRIEMLDRSTRIHERPGLAEFARLWLAWAPNARADTAAEAAELARPSLRPSSLRAVGRTGVRAAKAAAPGLASDVRQIAADRTLDPDIALRHVQEVVKAGGPTFVKLGQFIATARGLLPDEWVAAFDWCRDTVPAMPDGMAEQIFADTFGVPVDAVLDEFDPVPLGAASIGQVHAARLPDGTPVVIKFRRPGLREQFATDLRAMALAAGAAERASKTMRSANLSGFVELFAQLVFEEIDFRFEAVNQIELALASESAGHDFASFPQPIPHLVAENVLCMTRIEGVPYDRAVETYPDAVDGERLLRLAITSVLEHTIAYGVFHGDLHAGNVLITADGDFGLIDFGIAGRLDAQQRAATVEFLFGFASNDTRQQVRAMQRFGAIPEDADVDSVAEQINAALVAVDPALLSRDTPLSVDQLGQALGSVIRVLAANGFRLPSELVLFFKNLLYLNGFAAALAPDTDLLGQIQPVFGYFLERYPDELSQIMAGLGA